MSEISENKVKKKATNVFLSGKLSSTLIIPIEIARRHGLQKKVEIIELEVFS